VLTDGLADQVTGTRVAAVPARCRLGVALQTLSDVLVDVDGDGFAQVLRLCADLVENDFGVVDRLDADDDLVGNGSALRDVKCSRSDHFGVILQQSNRSIAWPAKQSPDSPRRMVVINHQSGNDVIGSLSLLSDLRSWSVANRAKATLLDH